MANKFKEKQLLAELLNELYDIVQRKEDSVHTEYRRVGEEQAKDWRTGELKWEDEEKTIPVMTDKWADMPKDELSADDELTIKVCQYVKTQLEKMI